jgi:hypothetical protein
MNFKRYIFALSVLIAFLHLSASAQRDTMSLNTIIAKTSKFTQGHPYEKVYLHMDKPYYTVGDTIWFKAYITAGVHQPSELSKILYIDVITARDTFVQALKLQIFNGIATGSLPITQALYKQGNYHLSAYTNWMRNFDPAYFFNKTITIGNPVDNQVLTSASITGSNKNKQQKVNVRIQFKDAVGNPYVNKKVSWTINNDDDKPLKGKENTDANGYLNINIAGSKNPVLASNYLFTTIDIGNKKTVNNQFPLRSAVAETDVQFFPEGGNLVSGVRSRIAFKGIKPDGLGVDIKGAITDNAGAVVAEIKSQHLGMGSFVITPEDGKTYKANITFADGSQNTFDLPKAQTSGISLAVYNTNPDTLNLKVTANSAYFQSNTNMPVYVVGQSNGFVFYAAQTALRGPVFSVPIPKNKFPTGLVQFTIFSGSQPLAERVVFIQHNDMLNLTMAPVGKIFAPRKQVTMQVTAKNKTAPVESSLSVSVIDETKVPFNEDAETTILTSTLLSSDLKGYIEKPNYYFNKPTEQTAADLDVLMMSQGYRRFLYQDILNDKLPRIAFLPEQGIEITGTLRNATGMPIAKGNVRLQIPDKYYSTQTTTNMSGEFKFSKLVIPDSSKVILNARNNVNANNLMLMVDGMSLQGISPNFNAPDELMNIDSALAPYMRNTKIQYNNLHTLKEVQIKDKVYVKKPGYQDYSALTGLSFPDHSIDGDRLKDCPNFVMCLQTMLMGITYDNNNFYVTRDYNQGNKTTPVAIFFNGMQVDYNYIAGLTSPNIESVEIFLNDGLSGINRRDNTKGVIEITTKVPPKGTKISKDQLAELFPPKYIATLTPKGFNMSREFYSPKYVAPPSVTDRADLRTTIYWNSRLTTDKTGAATFNFFNADGRGTYKAVIEGIDADGNIGRFVYRFKVQ